jgi:hypothetical protein
MGQLDFWVGTWDCTWEGGCGTNVVTSECGGVVLVERFESAELQGRSVSVQTQEGTWRQAWADSSGNYLQFAGGPDDDEFVLRNSTHRMRWTDIRPESFTWYWEKLDGELLWRIDYAAAG